VSVLCFAPCTQAPTTGSGVANYTSIRSHTLRGKNRQDLYLIHEVTSSSHFFCMFILSAAMISKDVNTKTKMVDLIQSGENATRKPRCGHPWTGLDNYICLKVFDENTSLNWRIFLYISLSTLVLKNTELFGSVIRLRHQVKLHKWISWLPTER
jgi:hypothetical protein